MTHLCRRALERICRSLNVEIVRRGDTGKFVVVPTRWIVERTFAWLNRCRRPVQGWERLNRLALAFLHWAPARRVLRRICQH